MTCSAKPVKGDFSVQACVLTCALVSVEMEHVRETCARRDCGPNRREEGDRVPRASAIHRFALAARASGSYTCDRSIRISEVSEAGVFFIFIF